MLYSVSEVATKSFIEGFSKDKLAKLAQDDEILDFKNYSANCASPKDEIESDESDKSFFEKMIDFFKGLFSKEDDTQETQVEVTEPTQNTEETTPTSEPYVDPTRTTFLDTDSNVINGEIDEIFSQGKLGDCQYLSALLSLTNTQEGRDIIKNTISINKNEAGEIISYDVTFKGVNKTYSYTPDEVKNNENGVFAETKYFSDEELRMMGYTEEEIANMSEEERYFETVTFGRASDFSEGDSDVLLLEMALKDCLNDPDNSLIQQYYKYDESDKLWGVPYEIIALLLTGKQVNTHDSLELRANDILMKSALKYSNEFMTVTDGQTLDVNGNKINIEAGVLYTAENYDVNNSGQVTLIHPQTNERITVNIDQLANDIEFCGPGMNVKQASVEEILGNINNKTAVMYGFNQQSTGEVEVADVNGKTHTIVDYHAYSVAAADENTITLINPHDTSVKITITWDEWQKISDGKFYSLDLA
ncbi:MAG: hypothetical protein IKL52_00150 [Candidatus Gastranaerophilales bacterium]|nr:hypothetical protein [Candidatus Gastranaerophilales bacterium]